MVVIGVGLGELEVFEGLAIDAGDHIMDFIGQIKVYPDTGKILICRSPVSNYMQSDISLGTVFHRRNNVIPTDRLEFDEHRRTLPWSVLIDEFDIAVPQVDMFYGPGIKLVIGIRFVRSCVIFPGCVYAKSLGKATLL